MQICCLILFSITCGFKPLILILILFLNGVFQFIICLYMWTSQNQTIRHHRFICLYQKGESLVFRKKNAIRTNKSAITFVTLLAKTTTFLCEKNFFKNWVSFYTSIYKIVICFFNIENYIIFVKKIHILLLNYETICNVFPNFKLKQYSQTTKILIKGQNYP